MTLSPTLASAAPGTFTHQHSHPAQHGKHSIASVQKQLGELALHNTQLVEKFDQARVLVDKREKLAAQAESAAIRARLTYHNASDAFTEMIQAQYETGSIGAAGALLDSQSGNNYLDRLTTLSLMSSHDADVVSLVTQAKAIAAAKQQTAQALLATAKKDRDALAAKRVEVRHEIAKYKHKLGILKAAARARFLAKQNPVASQAQVAHAHVTAAGSGAARIALQFAIHQIGKPYVWGAAGPSSYDCSGLTMASWAAAGVSLPHSAADQYNYGTHIAESQLRPGDLIFFYNPIGHVTIYAGNGMMVSAPTFGQPVALVALSYFQSDYAGATRLT